MINISLALIALSVHILVWEKLPEWGTLFNRILAKLPKPLQTLYEQWHCAYCAGFWIALVLHAFTGIWTVPALGDMAIWPLAWFLDALATATLVYLGSFIIGAVSLPAMHAYQQKAEFMAGMDEDKKD